MLTLVSFRQKASKWFHISICPLIICKTHTVGDTCSLLKIHTVQIVPIWHFQNWETFKEILSHGTSVHSAGDHDKSIKYNICSYKILYLRGKKKSNNNFTLNMFRLRGCDTLTLDFFCFLPSKNNCGNLFFTRYITRAESPRDRKQLIPPWIKHRRLILFCQIQLQCSEVKQEASPLS